MREARRGNLAGLLRRRAPRNNRLFIEGTWVSDRAFAGIAAEADRFVAQVVHGLDAADAAAFGAHQNRVGDRPVPGDAHAGEERAVADAGGAEDYKYVCLSLDVFFSVPDCPSHSRT